MTSLLHLDSSANRSAESISRLLTRLFVDTWRAAQIGAADNQYQYQYQYRDLAADPVPPLDTAYCTLGRRLEQRGLLPPDKVATATESPAESREWALTHPLIAELLAADTVLIGAPMYNYSIPASLKAWIDRVTFPGAFTDPETGDSLLRDTKVVVVTARGGTYQTGTPQEAWDFQTPYLSAYFSRHGVADKNVHFVSAEMTLAELAPYLAHQRPMAARSLASARAAVIALAEHLATRARTAPD